MLNFLILYICSQVESSFRRYYKLKKIVYRNLDKVQKRNLRYCCKRNGVSVAEFKDYLKNWERIRCRKGAVHV